MPRVLVASSTIAETGQGPWRLLIPPIARCNCAIVQPFACTSVGMRNCGFAVIGIKEAACPW